MIKTRKAEERKKPGGWWCFVSLQRLVLSFTLRLVTNWLVNIWCQTVVCRYESILLIRKSDIRKHRSVVGLKSERHITSPSIDLSSKQITVTDNINYGWSLWVHVKDQWWNVPFPTDSVTLVLYSSFLICKLCLIKAALRIKCGNAPLVSA